MTTDPARTAALQIAIIEALKWAVDTERAATRAGTAPMFAARRLNGDPSKEALLPDGTRVGLLSIHKGKTEAKLRNPKAFFAWVKAHRPHAIERYLLTGAAESTELLDLVQQHLPHLVGERIRAGDMTAFENTMADNKGRLVSDDGDVETDATGIPIVFADIIGHDPTGQVTYKQDPDGHRRVLTAWLRGDLDAVELGHLTRPELPPGPSTSGIPAGPIVPSTVITDDDPGTLW